MYLREIASGHYHQLFALAIKLHLAAYRSYIIWVSILPPCQQLF